MSFVKQVKNKRRPMPIEHRHILLTILLIILLISLAIKVWG